MIILHFYFIVVGLKWMFCGLSIVLLEPMHSQLAVTEHSALGKIKNWKTENPGSSLIVWIHQSQDDI